MSRISLSGFFVYTTCVLKYHMCNSQTIKINVYDKLNIYQLENNDFKIIHAS